MMTTMAALMGTLPIALGLGAGAESRRPLGVTVVGGLAFSQLVTLFLTPVVYIYLEQAKSFFSRRRAPVHADLPPAHATHPHPAGHKPAEISSISQKVSQKTDADGGNLPRNLSQD
jgi:HAE1 family hydrophobic/amphiphilic exporter-1